LQGYAYRLVSQRDYPVAKLRLKLLERFKNESQDERQLAAAVDELLIEFCEAGYLDDTRFVEGFVRSRVRQLQGPYKIKQGLRQRGLDETLIDQALTDIDWAALCQACLTNRLQRKSIPNSNELRAFKASLSRFLQGRGFAPTHIISALEQIDFETADSY